MAVHSGLKLPVYMDYHATTPVDPRVLESMLPFFTDRFGNAASRQHAFGWEAEEAVEKARRQVAGLIGATAKEIVFTSGATESDNLAIKGVAAMYRGTGNHIITAATEHKAVLDPCRRLEQDGYRVTWLPVQQDGRIRLDELSAAISGETILITIMAANNEIGVIQPIAEIGAMAKARGVLFHTDAVQMAGKVPFDVNDANVDLASLGAGDDLAHSSIRFGLGRWTTEEEVDYVADKITQVVTRLRDMSPFHEHAREGVDLSMLEWRRD